MDKKKLELDLTSLAVRRTALSSLDYHVPEYDKLEEELHALEDQFQDEFGDYLESVLLKIHEKYCPDSELLIPIAYMANTYIITDTKIEVDANQGVLLDRADGSHKVQLVLVPGPTRILLIESNSKNEVWVM